jgi:hypothetical protein
MVAAATLTDPLDFCVDLPNWRVTYGCGYACQILRMIDPYGECTTDPDEAYAIFYQAPESLVAVILDDLEGDRISR